MQTILYAILPIFIVIIIGGIAGRLQMFPSSTAMALNAFVIRIALPILLFSIIAAASPDELFQGSLLIGLLLGQLAAYGLGFAWDRLARKGGNGPAAVTAMSCSSSMTAFVGLPVIVALLPGDRQAVTIAGILAITPIVTIALGQIQLEAGKEGGRKGMAALRTLLRTTARNPLVAGLALGCIFCLGGIGLWPPLGRALNLLGSTSSACVLFALGLDMYNRTSTGAHGPDRRILTRQAGVSFIKLVCHPLLTWAALAALNINPAHIAVCVIMSSTGSAIACYVVAEMYATAQEESAVTVIATNALSLFSLTAFAYACTVVYGKLG